MESRVLLDWLRTVLPATVVKPTCLALAPLTGDAGFRCYFRLNTQPSLMAVFAPPSHEDNPAFVSKALALQARGVHTPRVYAVDYQRGFMLLEDFGDDLYSLHLDTDSVKSLYGVAEQALLAIQAVPAQGSIFPQYGESLLRTELNLFTDWFCGHLLSLRLTDQDHLLLEHTFNLLIRNSLEQPQVVVHRDYHCRNLMVLGNEQVGVIDFQDGVIGAITYDLASLLKDCYVRWPQQLVRERALNFAAQLSARGTLSGVSDEQFLRWFDWMGLQRHLKVLGIFSRLSLRDGKTRYLHDLPLVIRYTLEVLAQYKELDDFNIWFEKRILPELLEQVWYRPWQTAGEA